MWLTHGALILLIQFVHLNLMDTSFHHGKDDELELRIWIAEDGRKNEKERRQQETVSSGSQASPPLWETQSPVLTVLPSGSRQILPVLEPKWEPEEPQYHFPIRF